MADQILAQAAAWLDDGLPVALATVARITGSSSQPLGARMALTTDNRFVGSVSGGCVETDVYETGLAVLEKNSPVMLHYRQVENPLVEVGLYCDGQIDVIVEPLDRDLCARLRGRGRHVRVTLFNPSRPAAPEVIHAQVEPDGSVSAELPPRVVQDALAALKDDRPVSVNYPGGRVALFEPVLPPPTILICGAEAVAAPLVQFARLLGFRTVVTDPRPAFATRERFPDADLVLAGWPEEVIGRAGLDERTYIVSLNHEPRFEDALLRALVGRPVRYIGAIGKPSRREQRAARAAAAGFDLRRLPEIHTPIGLNIGGKSPEEIALSIIAQIVAVRNGRDGAPFAAEEGQLHQTKSGSQRF